MYPILKTVRKVPGGLMIIPLLLGVITNTLFPEFLEWGGFITPVWKTGAMTLIGIFLFCSGSQIQIKQAGLPLVKGVLLTTTELIVGIGIGLGVHAFFGPAGILGITPLALIAGISNSNGGLYASLAGQFGDSSDSGALSVLSINDGPFFALVALGASGIADISWKLIVAAVLPIVVGCILGNLDNNIRTFLEPGELLVIPFFSFPLGAGLSIQNLLKAGGPGILLGVVSCLSTGLAGYGIMKLIKSKHPQVGAAIGNTAGNAAAVPLAIAAADATFEAAEKSATIQVAAAVIVTAIMCPLLVTFLDKYEKKKQAEREAKAARTA